MILRQWWMMLAIVVPAVIFMEVFTSVRLIDMSTPQIVMAPSEQQQNEPVATKPNVRQGLEARGLRHSNELVEARSQSESTNVPRESVTPTSSERPQQKLPASDESFGACLMVKDDNEVLYEWISYHCTMLPLRYLVVLNDSGSMQDPMDVLRRWNSTDLQYWVWQQTEPPINTTLSKLEAHHELKARQNVFVVQCTRFMQSMNRTWVTHTDPDEYILLNRINQEDEQFRAEQGIKLEYDAFHLKNATVGDIMSVRRAIPSFPSDGFTALDLIHKATESIPSLPPCLVIQRVRVGALENKTCTDDTLKQSKELVRTNGIGYGRMTSLRFTQRQPLNYFPANTWAKVAVDVSRLTEEIIQKARNNVHRPFPAVCPKPKIPSYEALFYANHYSGSWDHFNDRSDPRREGNQSSFESSYLFDYGSTCEFGVHEWFPRFVRQVGSERAKYLLGATDSIATVKTAT